MKNEKLIIIVAAEVEYYFLGDRLTDKVLRDKTCRAVRKQNGKCIRGRNANMLVEFADGKRCVVPARRLRKIAEP